MDLDPATFETMSPGDFARTVSAMSGREIAEVMRGEHRVAILDAIFARFPDLFRPEAAHGVSSVTQLRITGGPVDHPEDTYEVVVADGSCTVSKTPGERADVSLRMAPAEFIGLVTGRGNAALAVMRGKIRVRGDLGQAARFSSYFGLPKG